MRASGETPTPQEDKRARGERGGRRIVAADIAITRRGFIINIAIDRGEIRACQGKGGGEEVRSNEAAAEGVVEEVFGRAARIVDGDTFWLARLKVRLWGVDSPELQQGCVAEGKVWHCGEEARALRSIVAVYCWGGTG